MSKFAKKIELDDTQKEIFFSFLLNGKYRVPTLSQEQEKLILHISEQFLFSGFILNSCDFNASHKNLTQQLKYQRRIQLQKQMSVKNDLNIIANNLNKRGIEHVFLKGAALNADGIYAAGMRFSRDIDLLVRVGRLSEAYDILKSIGYKYSNKNTQDAVRYHSFGHHFPSMVNNNNTKLELHWRVTKPSDFKNCPLTEGVLTNRIISKTNPNVFCPKMETTIAHLINHSFMDHRMNMGPIFLFDMAAIFISFNRKWPINNGLHHKLGIDKSFELCKNFIERVTSESSFSSESKLMCSEIFKHSHWLRLSDEPTTLNMRVKTADIKTIDNPSLLSKLLLIVRSTRTLYQVSYYSKKFWLILSCRFFNYVKRVFRRSPS